MEYNSPAVATEQNMAPTAHQGVFIAENLTKTGTRSSYAEWGIFGVKGANNITSNALFLSLCAKNGSLTNRYATNINITAANQAGKAAGDQPSLYVSGQRTESPRFMLHAGQGIISVTDSFSGMEKTTNVSIPAVYTAENTARVCLFGAEAELRFDFVVSAYRNEGLRVNQLSLPLRRLPAFFSESAAAVFEFNNRQLIEL